MACSRCSRHASCARRPSRHCADHARKTRMAVSTALLPDGARLTVHIEGQGPDLLLVSGLGGTASFWSPLVAALAARFRVVRFDQRGIGASTRGEVPVTI